MEKAMKVINDVLHSSLIYGFDIREKRCNSVYIQTYEPAKLGNICAELTRKGYTTVVQDNVFLRVSLP